MNSTDFLNIVLPLSMTSEARIIYLFNELEHIRLNNIDGDLVECGVYKGGNILGMMEYCNYFNLNKTIWVYDTFSGMTQPKNIDIDIHNNSASNIMDSVKCDESLSNFQKNISKSKYNYLKIIVGDVCETLCVNDNVPDKIALLRLDTDWHDSTKCELDILYPKVVSGGSIIIDDYGHWRGCRKAVDDYFGSFNYTKIDYTGIGFRK